MPIDASIPLQTKSPLDTLGSLLNIANSVQQYRSGQISNESNAALLQERNNLRALVNDPRVQDGNGNVDPIKFSTVAPMVAPTLGGPVSQSITGAQTAGITNQAAQYRLSADQADRAFAEAGGLYNDPRIQKLTQKPTQPDLDAAGNAISEAVDRMTQAGIPRAKAQAQAAPLYMALMHNPPQVVDMMRSIVAAGSGRGSQAGVLGNQFAAVPTQGGTQMVQTNAFAPGGAVAPNTTLPPPNQVVPTQSGPAVVNPATTSVQPLTPKASGGLPAPTVAVPPGETADTAKTLQDQRTEVQAQLRTLPERQNIYREIIGLTDRGVLTGSLGGVVQKLKSGLGYPGDAGADYNTLGKFLEQEAARTAVAMGPHTNAGLESARASGGTTGYDDKTLGKIARLAQANASALPLYDAGLQKAIASQAAQQPGMDPIFVKRDFDQKWANAYDPRAMRLKLAVDSGDQQEVQNIVKEVGGPNSKGANSLHMKLTRMLQLAGGQ